jgi:hypothetical protein
MNPVNSKTNKEIIMDIEPEFKLMLELITKWGDESWNNVEPNSEFDNKGPFTEVNIYIESMLALPMMKELFGEKIYKYKYVLNKNLQKYEGKNVMILHQPGDFLDVLIQEYIDKDNMSEDGLPTWKNSIHVDSVAYPDACRAFEMFKEIIRSVTIINMEIIKAEYYPFYCVAFIFEKEIDMVQLGKAKLMMA